MTEAIEWRGRVGNVWADEWRLTDMSFAALAKPLDAAVAAAAPERGQALDIGCGAGITTFALAGARPHLDILGVDLSERLVAVAAERGEGREHVAFRAADVTRFTDEPGQAGRFDFAFSRHGVMFFADPVAGFRSIRRLLRPGAALVFSCFADLARNPWVTRITGIAADEESANASPTQAGAAYAPGPFAFADPALVGDVLSQAGFIPGAPRLVDYAYRAGEGPDAAAQALHFFQRIGPAARMLATIEPDARPAILRRLAALLADHMRDGVVEFPAAAWIWTARADENG
ncbi:class I SAM-dependent methyltransferase [Sphingomonas sp. CL5.1]|uniref:class I SAM-dependent methyltransferase n=1 Tax=Sphingomonas sp. CL5.1 TaxID=2653203 RepID=UPI001581796D|nr:class I SAM-dependent methyltransferase [Sphingomonas sp. CL5.1]QKS00669.1 class I SAM-dependent methyltransferase [Sphingomonas sp. CL5.1]